MSRPHSVGLVTDSGRRVSATTPLSRAISRVLRAADYYEQTIGKGGNAYELCVAARALRRETKRALGASKRKAARS